MMKTRFKSTHWSLRYLALVLAVLLVSSALDNSSGFVAYAAKAKDLSSDPDPFGKKKVRKLKLNVKQDLEFGKVVSHSSLTGLIIIEPATNRRTVVNALDIGGRYGRAEFEVKGEPYKTYFITLPKKYHVKLNSGEDWEISNFNAFPGLIGTLGGNGKAIFYIGATAKISPNTSTKGNTLIQIFVDYQ